MSASIELRNKRVLVIGLARTGVATALFCASRGARVTATDARKEKELSDAVVALRKAGVVLELGGHRQEASDAVPQALVDGTSLVGTEAEVQRRCGG